jgi:hypothetical protein
MRSPRGVEAIGPVSALRPLTFGIILWLYRADTRAIFHVFLRLPTRSRGTIIDARTSVAKRPPSRAICRDCWIIFIYVCHLVGAIRFEKCLRSNA